MRGDRPMREATSSKRREVWCSVSLAGRSTAAHVYKLHTPAIIHGLPAAARPQLCGGQVGHSHNNNGRVLGQAAIDVLYLETPSPLRTSTFPLYHSLVNHGLAVSNWSTEACDDFPEAHYIDHLCQSRSLDTYVAPPLSIALMTRLVGS